MTVNVFPYAKQLYESRYEWTLIRSYKLSSITWNGLKNIIQLLQIKLAFICIQLTLYIGTFVIRKWLVLRNTELSNLYISCVKHV